MWKPYSEITNKQADFLVSYRFFSVEEGGRKKLPHQGYRSDFLYKEDDVKDGIYMIWPELLDSNVIVIKNKDIPIEQVGKAFMWILNQDLKKSLHSHRIKIGTKGYLMEGTNKVAEVEVIKIIGLNEN